MISTRSVSFLFVSTVLCCLSSVSSLNILVHSPAYAASHTNFMARLADTLSEAGHDVVGSEKKNNMETMKYYRHF